MYMLEVAGVTMWGLTSHAHGGSERGCFHTLETVLCSQGKNGVFIIIILSSSAKVKLERPVQAKHLRKGWERGDKVLI